MTVKWYATLRHPKVYPHTKFGIPTSKNIGDMDRTRKRDGRTDGLTDSAITICLPKFLWGHKKTDNRASRVHAVFNGFRGNSSKQQRLHIQNSKKKNILRLIDGSPISNRRDTTYNQPTKAELWFHSRTCRHNISFEKF